MCVPVLIKGVKNLFTRSEESITRFLTFFTRDLVCQVPRKGLTVCSSIFLRVDNKVQNQNDFSKANLLSSALSLVRLFLISNSLKLMFVCTVICMALGVFENYIRYPRGKTFVFGRWLGLNAWAFINN